MEPEQSPAKIDECLYSRQLYVLGHDAMRCMANADILISGLGGLGVEIAKNVILGGVKSVTLHDTEKCQISDLGSQFYLTEADVGRNRAEACRHRLSELNRYVQVSHYLGVLTENVIQKFQVVVLTETSLEDQLRISAITRANGNALIISDTRGLFSQIFCDFGNSFTVNDTTGEAPLTAIVANITNDTDGVVTCLDDSRHGFEDGDYVTFTEVQGMTELNCCKPRKIRVLGPYSFSIGDTKEFGEYSYGGTVTQVKMPKVLNFKPLKECLKRPEILISDSTKFRRPIQAHVAFLALHFYKKVHGRLPRPWNDADSKEFLLCVWDILKENEMAININKRLMDLFAKIASGNVNPMNAFVGGIVAQEVMKACSGKFHPIYQWFYFEAIDCLPRDLSEITEEDCLPIGSRYDQQIAVFGRRFQTQIGNLKYFIVGAGAIGCELLKNFAMIGVGTENGRVVVTDADLIEKSNLNRQFLFRPTDVQKPKSSTAVAAVKRMNPDINIIAHENYVGPISEKVYDDAFYESLDGVANALDNVDSRLYVDRRCVYYRKPLIESGTLGTKGNTQVVVPFLTESYSSSQDPPEKSIPICTLKNFPNAIEHTLQWARDTFEGLFRDSAESASQYMLDSKFIERTLALPGMESIEILERVKKTLVDDRPTTFHDCIVWARYLFEDQYNNQIRQLLFNFPPEQTTSAGQPFWSGHKRCPQPLKFDVNDSLHLDFIVAASNLKAAVYGISPNKNRQEIGKIASSVQVPHFVPKSGVKIAETDSQIQEDEVNDDDDDDSERLNQLLRKLPNIKKLKSLHLFPQHFEKDDDDNFHVDFVVAASNLRACNYKIPCADRHKSKLIAGKIIPAIATTTSVVAGLACLELLKLARNSKDISIFRNGFVNLALPLLAFSEPLAAPKFKYNNTQWTLWDRFEIQGEVTLRELLVYFKKQHDLEVTILSHGVCILYSFFMDQAKCQDRMNLAISDIVSQVSKKNLEPHVCSLALELCCMDMSGEDVDVPNVYYILPNKFCQSQQ